MSTLDRAARLFGDVREGEAARAFTLLLSFFMLMAAYYVLKTVREPLVLATGGQMGKVAGVALQAGVLLVGVSIYRRLVARVGRDRLMLGVFFFFFLCVQLFCVAAWFDVPGLGLVFYVWVGVFNLAMIAQFGSFANDIYTKEEGERLFPMIWVGATVGATAGSYLAGDLFEILGVVYTLEAAAVLLLGHIALLRIVQRRVPGGERIVAQQPASFSHVLDSPYLVRVALVMLLLNVVNTTGELVLSGVVNRDALEAAAAAGLTGKEAAAFKDVRVGRFYSDFFVWVNVSVVVVQSVVVSRLVKYAGFRVLLLVLPIVSLGAYGLVAAGAGLAMFRVVKMAENTADYSAMNTARGILWLPTTPEEKFSAKQIIDSFVVRVGDLVAAGVLYVGMQWAGLNDAQFAMVNLLVIVPWIVLSLSIARRYQALAETGT